MLTKVRHRLRALPLILSLGIFGIGAVSLTASVMGWDISSIVTGNFAKQVTVADLQQGKLKPVFLIDVRSPQEYTEDHIGQSPLVPLTEIEQGTGVQQVRNLVQKSVQPNQPQPTVVLYCTKGKRSTKAYKLLEATGLKMAVLSGGITAWRDTIPTGQDTTVLAPIAQAQR